ncbi:hypothetical protein [Candidatus Galacturonibacter soehngenii]|uniref:Uncharacterized protein n=1 Tax=Candidatus Galacturonatibacter soehngenii TaxID=2307010 RepID=A0A7V7QIW1_9FIRM|nr:hypothetical protein [Candidatus Galacturonibacter soehngenii]KAB1436074.1 hypothetical protein F7O84_17045 [Candidatus Galacturonibacter soehngenii]
MTCLYYNSNLNEYSTKRFRRPSKCPPVDNPYVFADFVKDYDAPPFINKIFKNGKDVILAYFGILANASNMPGYLGGCGSIGDSLLPYPYAYELLTPSLQAQMPLEEFIHSFQGIGHITLLNLHKAFHPGTTNFNTCYYMFEIESITGPSALEQLTTLRIGSYFVYHYGIISTTFNAVSGWKISKISSLPEDFLCAPDHGWIYSATSLVTFVYKDWYELITQIDQVKHEGNIVYVYASNPKASYRFDFIRITNGYDILLHENVCIKGTFQKMNLLKPQDQQLKLSILNPDLNLNFSNFGLQK